MDASAPHNKIPRVSIALPVFNGENYLEDALGSLLAQSFEDFEILIGDNASDDRTREICETYASQDKRIRYFRNDLNVGAAANYTRLFELARGEHFKWAAHDDICAPDFIRSGVEVLDSDPGVVLCCPREVAIDSTGDTIEGYMEKYHPLNHLGSASTHRRFHDLSCRHHGCYMVFGLMRSATLRQTPRIADYIGSDRVLLAELALLGRFWQSPEPIYFRRHSEQYCAIGNDAARRSWFNPGTGSGASYTDSRNFVEYRRAIARSELHWNEQLMCNLVLLDWARRKRHRLLREGSTLINTRFQSLLAHSS